MSQGHAGTGYDVNLYLLRDKRLGRTAPPAGPAGRLPCYDPLAGTRATSAAPRPLNAPVSLVADGVAQLLAAVGS